MKKREATVTDIDGNIYKTVKIGKQVWMAENLIVEHYLNGDPIPGEISDWSKLTTGARDHYKKKTDNETEINYGNAYNWHAVVDPRGLAPEGWHIPGIDEWQELSDYLGGDEVAGGKLKAKVIHESDIPKKSDKRNILTLPEGKSHYYGGNIDINFWDYPNAGATNESGFSALLGGYRDYAGYFDWIFYHGCFWTLNHHYLGWIALVKYYDSTFSFGGLHINCGTTVRCLKD
jgi:uncharacterized protein (TIGR02145 family)